MLRNYIRDSFWEYVLCVLASAAVDYSFMHSVYIPDDLYGRFLPVLGLCAVWQVLLFIAAYNRRNVIIALSVCVAAGVLYGFGIASGQIEPEGTIALYYLMTFLFSGAVFLLTRTRPGAVVAAVLGTLVIAACQFLQYGEFGTALLIYLFASACLVIGRRYRVYALETHSGRPAVRQAAGASAVFCAVAIALSLLVFFAVVRPLDPPTRELKLLTRIESLEISHQLGISSHIYLQDPDKTTTQTNDDETLTNNPGTDEQQQNQPDTAPQDSSQPSPDVFDDGAVGQDAATAVRYTARDWRWLYALITVAAAVTAAILGKKWLRRRKLRRMMSGGRTEQVVRMYNYLLRMLKFSGMPKQDGETVHEFNRKIHRRADALFRQKNAMSLMSGAFNAAVYGGREPSDAAYDMFVQCCTDFPVYFRRKFGRRRYLKYYFRF